MKKEIQKLIASQRRSPVRNKKAVTLVEVMIVTFITVIIVAVLFLVLNSGQLASSVNSEKLDLQAQVRRAIDWIERDIREALRPDLIGINHPLYASGWRPSESNIWFRLWDWNDLTASQDPTHGGNDIVEYAYNAATDTLTRTFTDASGNVFTAVFNDIIEAPFRTTYKGPGDPGNNFDLPTFSTNAPTTLIIAVTGQRVVKGSPITYTLYSEVRIRNE